MTKGNANKLAKEQFAHIYARYAGVDYSAEITANYIALWHSDFDESDMCFVIEAEAYSDTQVCFSAYLYPHDKERKLECAKVLGEVLGAADSLDDESMENKEWYIMLKEYEKWLLMRAWLISLASMWRGLKIRSMPSTKQSKKIC